MKNRPQVTSDGWRGILAEDFTGDFVRDVAATLGATTPKGLFIIGFDTRFMGGYLAYEMARMIASYVDCLGRP
jgi:phosphomannomutase